MREFKEMQKKQMKEWLRINKNSKGNKVEKRSKLNEFKRRQQQEEVTFLENALKRRQELEGDTQQQQADQLSSLSQQVLKNLLFLLANSFNCFFKTYLLSTRPRGKLCRKNTMIR